MAYFEQEFLNFLTELKNNNNKDWFDLNRNRYTKYVKEPFAIFVSDMISRIQQHDPTLMIDPKDCILRINRDIRFSKDKTPYNPYVTAFISNGGRKDKSHPGIFFRLTPTELGVMGGCFMPDKTQLQKIREAIIADTAGFERLLAAPSFVEKFEGLKGEVAKRLPPEWKEAAIKTPSLARKQFYFTAMLDSSLVLKNNLAETIMEHWQAARPVNSFLKEAIQ